MMQDVRRDLIAAELAQNKFMSVEAVAARFNCSLATARRDLQALASAGRIRRSRGGALAATAQVAGESARALELAADPMVEVKRRIARAAAALVKDGDTVGLGGGSTVLAVARCLRGRHIGVVTNALDPALELAVTPGARVVLLGGVLDASWGRELVGSLTELALSQLSMEMLFLSVNGISVETGLTVIGEQEAQVLRTMSGRARRVVVVADHTKIGRAALTRVLPIDGADVLVTDTAEPNQALEAIRRQGVEVIEV